MYDLWEMRPHHCDHCNHCQMKDADGRCCMDPDSPWARRRRGAASSESNASNTVNAR